MLIAISQLRQIYTIESPKRNSTMFRCNRFQIKLQIQKPLIVNFKIRNSQKFHSIVSFFLGINHGKSIDKYH